MHNYLPYLGQELRLPFPRGSGTEFGSAVLGEPSVFELLSFFVVFFVFFFLFCFFFFFFFFFGRQNHGNYLAKCR